MKKVCTIIAAIILFCSAGTNSNAQPSNLDPIASNYLALNEAGARKALEGKTEQALQLFRRSLDLEPQCESCRYNLGWVFIKMNRYEDAIAELKKVVIAAPNRADANALLGEAYVKLGHYSASLPYLERALEYRADADLLMNLGYSLLQLDRKQESIVFFERATQIEPNNFKAHSNLGYALFQFGHFKRALESFRKALELNPQPAVIHNNIGMVYEQLGKYDKALSYYHTAVKLEPNLVVARVNLAFFYLNHGNRMAAYDQLKEIEKLDTPAAEKLRDALQEKFVVKVSENK